MNSHVLPFGFTQRLRAFLALTKPRVVSLIVFTAVIGMLLATPGGVPPQVLFAGTLGIALVAGAAAAVNCLVEQKIDAVMRRTRWRPLPRGQLTSTQTLIIAGALGGLGMWLLGHFVNALTMWLTLATFVGYAVVYTVLLKPATPQNIVIGGASGAMPPVLGWAAVTGEVTTEAMLLFLIIFAWTPPHFWALALYRTEDYAKAGVPMLPVTHGKPYTRLQVLLYTFILFAVSLLPYVIRMSGLLYLAAAVVLGGIFTAYALRLHFAGKTGVVNREVSFACNVGGQVGRKPVGVIQLEYDITRNFIASKILDRGIEDFHALFQRFRESFFFELERLFHLLLLLAQFRIGFAHFRIKRVNQLVEKKSFLAQLETVAYGPANDPAQYVAAAFVRRQYAVDDQE